VFTRLSARVYKNEKPASKPAAWVDRNLMLPDHSAVAGCSIRRRLYAQGFVCLLLPALGYDDVQYSRLRLL
jgi:hypothetical protein